MLVLLDRGFVATGFFAEIRRAAAKVRAWVVLPQPAGRRHRPDGSRMSCLDGISARIIQADVTATGACQLRHLTSPAAPVEPL